MRILKKFIDYRERVGGISVQILSTDDLWFLYNIILPGDEISSTVDFRERKLHEFKKEAGRRKKVTLAFIVKKVSYITDNIDVEVNIKCVVLDGPGVDG
jgi:stalled ribosome rescue protein Dom34